MSRSLLIFVTGVPAATSERNLYKADFNPVRVEFHRSMPREGAEPYEKLMRAPVSFSHMDGLLVLDQADLRQPLAGSCPELAQVNDNIAIDYLARLDRSDVITGVTKKIIDLLPDGECSRDKMASALGMSPSTLQLNCHSTARIFSSCSMIHVRNSVRFSPGNGHKRYISEFNSTVISGRLCRNDRVQ